MRRPLLPPGEGVARPLARGRGRTPERGLDRETIQGNNPNLLLRKLQKQQSEEIFSESGGRRPPRRSRGCNRASGSTSTWTLSVLVGTWLCAIRGAGAMCPTPTTTLQKCGSEICWGHGRIVRNSPGITLLGPGSVIPWRSFTRGSVLPPKDGIFVAKAILSFEWQRTQEKVWTREKMISVPHF